MKHYFLLFVALICTFSSWAITPIVGPHTVCAGNSITLTNPTSGGTWSSSLPGVGSVGSLTGLVTGITAGVTDITYTTGSGFAVHSVTVNAGPTMCTVTGGGSYCSGGPCPHVGLSCSGIGNSYQLYRGASAVGAPLAGTGSTLDFGMQCTPGTYTVVGTNPVSGCSANMTGSVTITMVSPPGAISGSLIICAGTTSTLTNGTPGGTWSSSNPSVGTVGSSSGVVAGISAGTTTITYSLASGCEATATVTVMPLPCTYLGTILPGPVNNISIYPNPATTELTIELPNTVGGTSYTITDQLGRQLLHAPITTHSTTVSIRTLPSGLYHITVKGPEGNIVRKFVKE